MSDARTGELSREWSVYFADDGHRMILGEANARKVVEKMSKVRKVRLESRLVAEWHEADPSVD